jgi:autophagy-related protein 18
VLIPPIKRSCVSVGTRKGYSITNCDPFGRVYTMSESYCCRNSQQCAHMTTDDGARSIVEMLFCTSLLALVGAADQPQSSPRKLQIVNTKVRESNRVRVLLCPQHAYPQQRGSTICELLFPNSILAVKMNRKTLVVVLETEIYIYDISNMKLLHVIETTPNPEGQMVCVFCA